VIEVVPDPTLAANLRAAARQKQELGIGGHFNRSANDDTISRFGWKAQAAEQVPFALCGRIVTMEQELQARSSRMKKMLL
jgi:hypothetical protein